MAKDNTTIYIIAGAAVLFLFRKQLGISGNEFEHEIPALKPNNTKNLQYNAGILWRESNAYQTNAVLNKDPIMRNFGSGMKYTLDKLFSNDYLRKGLDKAHGLTK